MASSKKKTPVVSQEQKLQAYNQAYWLYDNMTSQAAIWQGDSQYQGPSGSAAQNPQASTWSQIPYQLSTTTTLLNTLATTIADPSEAQAYQTVSSSLGALDTAVTTLAQARVSYLQADAAQKAAMSDPTADMDKYRAATSTIAQQATSFNASLTSARTLLGSNLTQLHAYLTAN